MNKYKQAISTLYMQSNNELLRCLQYSSNVILSNFKLVLTNDC